MCKPLTDEELWGDPETCLNADQTIEDLMDEEMEDSVNFDDAHECPNCGDPISLCICRCGDQ